MAYFQSWYVRTWGPVETIIAISGPGIVVAAVIAVEFVGAKQIPVQGTIVRLSDDWTLKYGSRCFVYVDTKFGRVSNTVHEKCPKADIVGAKVDFKLLQNRLTGGFISMYFPLSRIKRVQTGQARSDR